jgi:hypothetical protein
MPKISLSHTFFSFMAHIPKKFLNLGAGFTQHRDLKDKVDFAPLSDVKDLLENNKRPGQPMLASEAYMLEHAYKFIDHPCWHDRLWGAYNKVSVVIRHNYRNARLKRPACPYGGADALHVAIHMRRGDVMKGDPEKITRCGKKIFPVLPNSHPRWRSYWMEDFARRSNEWEYFLALMKSITQAARAVGKRAHFHIFSQTSTAKCDKAFLEDFPEFAFPKAAYPAGRTIDAKVVVKGEDAKAWPELQNVHMVLNNNPSECFHCLVEADVLLVAKSTFSIVAAMLASAAQVRIYPPMPGGGLWEHHKAGQRWLVASMKGGIDKKELERLVARGAKSN